jgi:hypothetical protein
MFVGTETNTQSHCATHAFSQIGAHQKSLQAYFICYSEQMSLKKMQPNNVFLTKKNQKESVRTKVISDKCRRIKSHCATHASSRIGAHQKKFVEDWKSSEKQSKNVKVIKLIFFVTDDQEK